MGVLEPGDDEREMLAGFLDWFRGIATQKVADLDLDAATRVATPTGLTLLGILKHLTWVEHLWFDSILRGLPRPETDNPGSFVIAESDSVDAVLAAYATACLSSRQVAAATALDVRSATAHGVYGHVTLRWTLVHLIEETARHCGHMDVLRELTDGRTG